MWSGGEASKARLHADYKLALRRDQAPLLREAGGWEVSPDGLGWVWCLSWAYLPKGWPAALIYTASETLARPGRCASLSSFVICVYLCASVVNVFVTTDGSRY